MAYEFGGAGFFHCFYCPTLQLHAANGSMEQNDSKLFPDANISHDRSLFFTAILRINNEVNTEESS